MLLPKEPCEVRPISERPTWGYRWHTTRWIDSTVRIPLVAFVTVHLEFSHIFSDVPCPIYHVRSLDN